MNATEKKYASQISEIMRAARKLLGYTQVEASKALGITQGTLSKLEQGELVISTPLWFEFCQIMKISSRAFLLGYIDVPLPKHVDISHDLYPDNLFSLPKAYSFSKGTAIRGNRGILKYAQQVWGAKKFHSYLVHKKVDPDFLTVLPNQINLQFDFDLLTALKDSGELNKESLKSMALPYQDASFHGEVGHSFEGSKNRKELVKSLAKKLDRYQVNFNYTLESSETEAQLIGKPAPFIGAFSASSEVAQSLCEVKAHFFESSIKILPTQKVKVKHTHCFYRGDQECRFVIPM